MRGVSGKRGDSKGEEVGRTQGPHSICNLIGLK